MLAAARSDHVAFVINISGASVSFAEQTFTEMGNTARQQGLSNKQVGEVLELNRAAAEYLVTGNWEKYARQRERALKSEWGKLAAGFPGSPDLAIWTFLRGVAAYDPLPCWIQLTEPLKLSQSPKMRQAWPVQSSRLPCKNDMPRASSAFESFFPVALWYVYGLE